MAFHTWIYILIGHCFYFMIRMAMSDTTRQEEKDAQQKAIDEAVAGVTLSYEIKLSRAQSMIQSLRETRDRLERQLTNLSQSKEELAKKKGNEIEKLIGYTGCGSANDTRIDLIKYQSIYMILTRKNSLNCQHYS